VFFSPARKGNPQEGFTKHLAPHKHIFTAIRAIISQLVLIFDRLLLIFFIPSPLFRILLWRFTDRENMPSLHLEILATLVSLDAHLSLVKTARAQRPAAIKGFHARDVSRKISNAPHDTPAEHPKLQFEQHKRHPYQQQIR
jgi:hypothetical protein